MEDNWMSRQELRYIAYTSASLAKFLDKDLYQFSVNTMDKDVILDVELMLAEEFIKNYVNIQEYVKSGRKKFLSKKNVDHRMTNGNQLNNDIVNNLHKTRSEAYQSKTIHKFQVKRACEKIVEVEPSAKGKSLGIIKKHANRVAAMIKQSYRGRDPEAEMRKNEFQKRNIDVENRVASTMFGRITETEYRHQLHPNSKLFMTDGSIRKDNIKHTIKKDYKMDQKDIVESYKIPRYSTNLEPQKFINTYSMGPLEMQISKKKIQLSR